MESSEGEMSFRVNFTATKNIIEQNMILTFFGTERPFLIEKNLNFLLLINKTIKNAKSGYTIVNITEILPSSERYNLNNFIAFSILLFKEKEVENPDIIRKGYLIGNSKDKGFFILGVWPYTYYQEISGNFKSVIDKIMDLIDNPGKFTEILLLTQK